jgi:hypothetical protein
VLPLTRRVFFAGIAGLAVAYSVSVMTSETPVYFSDAYATEKKYKFIGASSCASTSCHGGKKPAIERPSTEYQTWSKKDPHSNAFDKLVNEAADDILEAFNEEADKEIEDATTDMRCIRCHTVGVLSKEFQGSKFNIEDGVSCDRCHGAGSGYIPMHDKKTHDYNKSLTLGMWDTRNLTKRAEICISCHLQLSPELIDAGHPDLTFELFSYTDRQKPHWYERNTWDGVRVWLVGQASSLNYNLDQIIKAIAADEDDESLVGRFGIALGYTVAFKHGVAVYGDAKLKASFKTTSALLAKEEDLDKAASKKAFTETHALLVALGAKYATSKDFTMTNVKAVWKAITSDKEAIDNANEYDAEQISSALLALHNAVRFGRTPRLDKAIDIPAAFKTILVKPSALEPEALFDDESEFQSEAFAKALAKVAGLMK